MIALGAMVLEPLIECLPFLFLPAFQDFFSPSVVHIRWSDVSDSFVIAPLVLELGKLRDGRAQFFGTGPQGQIHPALQPFVKTFEFANCNAGDRCLVLLEYLHGAGGAHHLQDVRAYGGQLRAYVQDIYLRGIPAHYGNNSGCHQGRLQRDFHGQRSHCRQL